MEARRKQGGRVGQQKERTSVESTGMSDGCIMSVGEMSRSVGDGSKHETREEKRETGGVGLAAQRGETLRDRPGTAGHGARGASRRRDFWPCSSNAPPGAAAHQHAGSTRQ